MRLLTLAAVLTASLLSPVAVSAAEPTEDWRTAACTDQGTVENAPSGSATLVASSRVPVDGVTGVQVGVDRLDFSGVTCEVLYVDGALPRGVTLSVDRNQTCATFDQTLDGTEAGGSSNCSGVAGEIRLYSSRRAHGVPHDVQVLAVEAFQAVESLVIERGPGVPPRIAGKTLTTTHTGSTWRVRMVGNAQTRHEFDRSRATDRAARVAYARQVARAERTYEEKVAAIRRTRISDYGKRFEIRKAAAVRDASLAIARKKQRLALDGVRLVVRDLRVVERGKLPAA